MKKLLFVLLFLVVPGCEPWPTVKHDNIQRVFFNTSQDTYTVLCVDDDKLVETFTYCNPKVYLDVDPNEPIWGQGHMTACNHIRDCELHLHSAKEIGTGAHKNGKHDVHAEAVE